jgi:hypothetical protein
MPTAQAAAHLDAYILNAQQEEGQNDHGWQQHPAQVTPQRKGEEGEVADDEARGVPVQGQVEEQQQKTAAAGAEARGSWNR